MDGELVEVLEEAQQLGFLGPGPVPDHIDHSRAFVEPLSEASPPFLDLGSGGGAPGLILAALRKDWRWLLVDSEQKRCRFLRRAARRLGLEVEVVCGRAEVLAHDPALRATVGAVTARSFGPPAVTAECGAPFLRVGGLLLVAEPPNGENRWPAEPLLALGLRPVGRRAGTAAIQILDQATPCPARFPRRTGVPARHPLF